MSDFSNDALRAIHQRRAVHRFSQKPVPEPLLDQALDAANWAPSGFNLQPWYFLLVRNQDLRMLLSKVAMNQQQICEAPLTVVFVANPNAWKKEYQQLLDLGEEAGLITAEHRKYWQKQVEQTFRTGPFGLYGFIKRVLAPFLRIKRPVAATITSTREARHYVRAQTMLSAQNFMIAAQSLGLDTCPMEGFDEGRLKKLLAIPEHMTVPVIIPTGYRLEDGSPTVRLPLSDKVKVDLFRS